MVNKLWLLVFLTHVHVHQVIMFRLQQITTRTSMNRESSSRHALQMLNRYIPADLSTVDKAIPSNVEAIFYATPNVDIHPLEGGSFLGIMLWAYVLYNGLFGLAGRPADWTLPILARITKQDEKDWYKDFKDGYSYFCPVGLEALRVIFFGGLGYITNDLCIQGFDGDVFWGWSIGICLALPSALINISRDKLVTREKGVFNQQFEKDFQYFANNKLEKDYQSKSVVALSKIISQFRTDFRQYRNIEVLTDREIRKLVRKWAGSGLPLNKNEEFRGIRILETGRDVQEEIAKTKARLDVERKRLQEEAEGLNSKCSALGSGNSEVALTDRNIDSASIPPPGVNDFSR